eukprot:TRINITY_DN29197_c0_g1_i1.p1 TRINITY_DN29197_c0_g1~~TRINITY_DN29197_c0_g1_i1.p1  ORF type:complete len:113 (-),score=13.45 TRINITY_DN29197_c0_g1_i1:221-559(-)
MSWQQMVAWGPSEPTTSLYQVPREWVDDFARAVEYNSTMLKVPLGEKVPQSLPQQSLAVRRSPSSSDLDEVLLPYCKAQAHGVSTMLDIIDSCGTDPGTSIGWRIPSFHLSH